MADSVVAYSWRDPSLLGWQQLANRATTKSESRCVCCVYVCVSMCVLLGCLLFNNVLLPPPLTHTQTHRQTATRESKGPAAILCRPCGSSNSTTKSAQSESRRSRTGGRRRQVKKKKKKKRRRKRNRGRFRLTFNSWHPKDRKEFLPLFSSTALCYL